MLVDKQKVSRKQSLGFTILSFMFPYSNGEMTESLRPNRQRTCGLSIHLISGLSGSSFSPYSPRGFPSSLLQNMPAFPFMLPEISGSFLLRMGFFDPYVTFVQELGLILFVKVRITKEAGRSWSHSASLPWHNSTSLEKH